MNLSRVWSGLVFVGDERDLKYIYHIFISATVAGASRAALFLPLIKLSVRLARQLEARG
jgi:hypothetical protein